MENLFEESTPLDEAKPNAPLAERMRPKSVSEVIGQSHLLGENAPLRKFFERKNFPSMILWGNPGTGKTSLASLIAQSGKYVFHKLSAIESGVKELREVIDSAKRNLSRGKHTLLFIDEIHRFNKSQQDALLGAVESGTVTLIGATTENPSFEVNAALLSRCKVYHLEPLREKEIELLIERALSSDFLLKNKRILIEDMHFFYRISGGDARTALGALEVAVMLEGEKEEMMITHDLLERALQQKILQYDKKGESHYDTISAFIKSLRGSDPDAALLWLAKMLEAGEDPKFIARRMVIFASEDIGNAEPIALQVAVAVFQAVELIGLPEARINLAHGVTFLASCPKSNASYLALDAASTAVQHGMDITVPIHLRNAPTSLMKKEGYGADYRYPHDFDHHFTNQHYFPASIQPVPFYKPTLQGKEKEMAERLLKWWPERYPKDV